jgi:hypothetical protein
VEDQECFLVLYSDHPLYHYQGISVCHSRTYLSAMIANIATERDPSITPEEVRDAKGRSSLRTWESCTEIVVSQASDTATTAGKGVAKMKDVSTFICSLRSGE